MTNIQRIDDEAKASQDEDQRLVNKEIEQLKLKLFGSPCLLVYNRYVVSVSKDESVYCEQLKNVFSDN